MREPQRKRHFVIHNDQLCDLLGIKGDAINVYAEQPSEYVHIIVLDDSAPFVQRGAYPESQTITTSNAGSCESCDQHRTLIRQVFNVCSDCAPSTTLDPEPAIIPVHSDLSPSGAA